LRICFKSSINIIFDRVGKVDPVTRSIEIIVNYFAINFDVQFWSQHISFYVVGIIVFTSIRGFLITLTKVLFRFTTRFEFISMANFQFFKIFIYLFKFFYAISSKNASTIIVLILTQIMVKSCVLRPLKIFPIIVVMFFFSNRACILFRWCYLCE
jgi:hypothetical protein